MQLFMCGRQNVRRRFARPLRERILANRREYGDAALGRL